MRSIASCCFILALFFISMAHADSLNIGVDEVNVYAETSTDSDVIATLNKGDSVSVSKKSYGQYLKVLVDRGGGKKRAGFVKISEVRGKGKKSVSKLSRGGSGKSGRGGRLADAFASRTTVGVILGVNYSSQGARTIAATTNPPASAVDVSSLSGLATEFGLKVGFPINHSMAVDTFLIFKSVSLSGSATIQSTSPRPVETYLTQSFLAFGGTWKYYGNVQAESFWWGAGVEFDKSTSSTIKYGNVSTTTDASSFFIFPYLALGFDWGLSKNIVMQPEFRLGAAVNSTPITIEGDFLMGLAYGF